jgi:hypothetical protein
MASPPLTNINDDHLPDDNRANSVAESVNDINIDISNDELKNLSQYFEKSRAELQKKVDLLFQANLNFANKKEKQMNVLSESPAPPLPLSPTPQTLDSIIENKKGKSIDSGIPIDLQTASV